MHNAETAAKRPPADAPSLESYGFQWQISDADPYSSTLSDAPVLSTSPVTPGTSHAVVSIKQVKPLADAVTLGQSGTVPLHVSLMFSFGALPVHSLDVVPDVGGIIDIDVGPA